MGVNLTEAEKARDKAANYINIKPRTKKQVIRYLKDKGFDEAAITEAVRELEEYRYIDDEQYCRMYFEYGFDKGRGIARIKRELAEKGVASDVIQFVYEELEDVPDQFEMAREAANTMIMSMDTENLDYDARRRLQAKIGRRLMSRGFSSDIVYKVINNLF